MSDSRARLLKLYDLFPFHDHPLWQAVLRYELSHEQIIIAEVQHWIRTRAGQRLRGEALTVAKETSPRIFEFLFETYLEECTETHHGPNHLDLIERLVIIGGYPQTQLSKAISMPGNSAAIALYRDIGSRGSGCHMLGAGTVEHYYSALCPKIYEVYTQKYGMTAAQAETYRIHGTMDSTHADRAFAILEDAINIHGFDLIETSVRDAFVATSLHYDGMLQAATKEIKYWDGGKT